MYYIKDANGQFWTGECWGVFEAREFHRRDDIMTLKIDRECNPETFFDNAPDDIGWGDEDGKIFARAMSKASENLAENVAQTIFKQFGGGRAMAMIGGTPVADGNSLRIRFKTRAANGANFFKITLNGMDTYDLEFGRVRGTTYKVIKTFNGAYNDMLRDIFRKETQLNLSL